MNSIEADIKRARALKDPLRRCVEIQACYKRAKALTQELADERGSHIIAAHNTGEYSYGDIAESMDVSKPLVQQLIRPKKSRRKVVVKTRKARAA